MIDFLLSPLQIFAACSKNFLGFPTWYKYLEGGDTCNPKLTGLNDLWLIALALIEILLRVAVLVAIAYVLLGGFKFVTSRANPDKTLTARNTVIDGIVGLIIAVVATAVVSYIAGRFN